MAKIRYRLLLRPGAIRLNMVFLWGMPATFIAVKGDPTGLPESLKKLLGVWVKGELIG